MIILNFLKIKLNNLILFNLLNLSASLCEGKNSDFASNTFTAPETGKYHLDAMARVQAIDSASSYYFFQITTSNRVYQHIVDPDYGQDNDYYTFNVNVLADMDANDTAYVIIQQGSGTAQSDLQTKTHFSGYLAC